MAIGENGAVYVLLNGAFEPHPFGKKYAMSRGIMVLESLDHDTLFGFSENFRFDEVEPFTLLRFGEVIEEIRWDGESLHTADFSRDHPRIWASAQLYAREAMENRRAWYADLLKNNPDAQEVFQFHQSGGNGDPANDMVMNRGNIVCTVSVTGIVVAPDEVAVNHLDLVSDARQQLSLSKSV